MSSAHCFLRTENRSFCHGVVRPECLISHTYKRKSIAGNVIIRAQVSLCGNDPIYM